MYPIKVETVTDLLSKIALVPNDSPADIYRGEPKIYAKPCTPSLFRDTELNSEVGIFNEFRNERSRVEEWCKQVEATEGAFLPYRCELDKMILARHYDLLTRLLDWSSNPLVSCWFACGGNDYEDGCIYTVVEPLSLDTKSELLQPHDNDRWNALEVNPFCLELPDFGTKDGGALKPFHSAHFFRPSSLPNPRILSQGGIISIHPNPDEKSEKFNPFRRFTIPAKNKRSLRNELKVLGIDDRSLGFATRDSIASKLNKSLNE